MEFNPLDMFDSGPQWPESALSQRAVLLSQLLAFQEQGKQSYIVCNRTGASFLVKCEADAERELWEAFKGTRGSIDSIIISASPSNIIFSECLFDTRRIYDEGALKQLPKDQQEILKHREWFILETGITPIPGFISTLGQLDSVIEQRGNKRGTTFLMYFFYLRQLERSTPDEIINNIVVPLAHHGNCSVKNEAIGTLKRLGRLRELHALERAETQDAFDTFCVLSGEKTLSGISSLKDLDAVLDKVPQTNRAKAESAYFESLTTQDATDEVVRHVLGAAFFPRGTKPGPHQGIRRKHLALQALNRLEIERN